MAWLACSFVQHNSEYDAMSMKVKSPGTWGPQRKQRVGTGSSPCATDADTRDAAAAGGSVTPIAPSAAAVRTPRKIPYVSLRDDGRYYFTRRYPSKYLVRGVFKQAAYRKTLGTSDRLIAERKARDLAVRFDRVIEWLDARDARRAVVPPKVHSPREVLGDDVKVLGQRFEALLLHSDDLDRAELMTMAELTEYTADVQSQRQRLHQANTLGDFGEFTEETRSFLEAEQLTCEEGTETWNALLRAMTKAQLSGLRGSLT